MAILGKERWQVWEEIYESILILQDIFSEASQDRTHSVLLAVYRKYIDELFTAIDQNKKIIYGNFAVPGTLMRGFDTEKIFWFQLEAPSVIQGLVGEPMVWNAHYADKAEAAGMAPDICSVDRIGLGAYLEGVTPRPDAGFYLTTPCDSQTCLVNSMVSQTHAPTIVVDMPYKAEREDVLYVVEQYRRVIEFLEKSTGVPYEFDRLKNACDAYNRMMGHIADWVALRRVQPASQPCETLSLMAAVVTVFSGHESGVNYARETLLELKEMISRGDRAVDGEEVRAVWYGDPMWSDINFYNWLEATCKVTVPMDMFGYFNANNLIETATEQSMLEGIAYNSLRNFPMTRQLLGSMEDYLFDYRTLCLDYGADFGVVPGHLGCTHAWGALGLLQEESDRLGIPLLLFEFDMLDPRITPRDDLEIIFNNFVEDIVLPRKNGNG